VRRCWLVVLGIRQRRAKQDQADEYRRRAEECLGEAETAPASLRLQLITIAQRWFEWRMTSSALELAEKMPVVRPCESAAPALAAAGMNRTVLLVDDDSLVRMVLSDMLIGLGFDVTEAGSPAEGFVALQQAHKFDLLIFLSKPRRHGVSSMRLGGPAAFARTAAACKKSPK
jgi:hypothetical protein